VLLNGNKSSIELIPFPDPEEYKNFQKTFSGFMSFFKILEIILGLHEEVSGSGRSPNSLPKSGRE
jgi:hypothetical protein